MLNRSLTAITAAIAITVFGWASAGQTPTFFKDTLNVNVLRQYGEVDGSIVNLVTAEYDASPGVTVSSKFGFSSCGSTDSFWHLETAEDWGRVTYTLPGERTIGAYTAHMIWQTKQPAAFVFEALVDGVWVELDRKEMPGKAEVIRRDFSEPVTASSVRYTVVGPSQDTGQNRVVEIVEVQVWMAADQRVPITDGYNWLPDYVSSTWPSPVNVEFSTHLPADTYGGIWGRLNPTVPDSTLFYDGAFNGPSMEAAWDGGDPSGPRVFAILSFDSAMPLDAVTVGEWRFSGALKNWTLYTSSDLDHPEMQNLPDSNPSTIEAAGWTQQYAQGGTGIRYKDVPISDLDPAGDGKYRHIAFVLDYSSGKLGELELYAVRPLWPIRGDANRDCKVNILDLIFVRNRLNAYVTTGDNWQADVNQDERINILDLIYVRNRLNDNCPAQ